MNARAVDAAHLYLWSTPEGSQSYAVLSYPEPWTRPKNKHAAAADGGTGNVGRYSTVRRVSIRSEDPPGVTSRAYGSLVPILTPRASIEGRAA